MYILKLRKYFIYLVKPILVLFIFLWCYLSVFTFLNSDITLPLDSYDNKDLIIKSINWWWLIGNSKNDYITNIIESWNVSDKEKNKFIISYINSNNLNWKEKIKFIISSIEAWWLSWDIMINYIIKLINNWNLWNEDKNEFILFILYEILNNIEYVNLIFDEEWLLDINKNNFITYLMKKDFYYNNIDIDNNLENLVILLIDNWVIGKEIYIKKDIFWYTEGVVIKAYDMWWITKKELVEEWINRYEKWYKKWLILFKALENLDDEFYQIYTMSKKECEIKKMVKKFSFKEEYINLNCNISLDLLIFVHDNEIISDERFKNLKNDINWKLKIYNSELENKKNRLENIKFITEEIKDKERKKILSLWLIVISGAVWSELFIVWIVTTRVIQGITVFTEFLLVVNE
jgi:hypothetical protein